jgi:retinol dehydrogenase-12
MYHPYSQSFTLTSPRANLKVSHLILACRDLKKGEDAQSKIYAETNCEDRTKIEVWDVDLASYKSVERFGGRVRTELERLDGFIANAGVEMTDFELSEGLETTLTVNVVSTILMAIAVLPKLRETAGKFNVQTNLSIVGSMVHALGNDKAMDLPESTDILENLSHKETADMAGRYNMSKMLLHEAFHELCNTVSAKYPNDNVVLNIVNPGWCSSELGRYKQPGLPQRMIFALIGRTSEQGARTLVHAVTAGKETHGKYLSECQVKKQSEFMRSERGMGLHKRVWEQLEKRLEGVTPDTMRLL